MPDIFTPRTLEELLDLKQARSDLAVFAGGTDLMIALRHGRVRPGALACLDRIHAMGEISDTGTHIALGAAATHTRILSHTLVQSHAPVLAKALETLGSPHIRNMGTIGGNLVTASPAGDALPPLTVLDALVETAGREGFRTLPVRDFITGPGTTRLAPDQVVWRILIPKAPAFSLHHFEKVGLRRSLSIAVVSLAALLDQGPEGRIRSARLALGSVGPRVVPCPRAEELLTGNCLDPGVLELAAGEVRSSVTPISDVRATAEYRRRVAGNLVLRLDQYLPGKQADTEP